MKKVIMTMLVLVTMVGVSFAGINEDMAAARALYNAGNYAAAKTAFEALIADYPTGAAARLSFAQMTVGDILHRFGNTAQAEAAYKAVVSNYPDAPDDMLAHAQIRVGDVLLKQFKSVEAQAAYQAVIDDYPDAHANSLATAQLRICDLLFKQGDPSLGAAYLKIADYGDTRTLRGQVDVLGKYVTKAEYVAYLTKVLMIIPATEANAEVLGKVKSKLKILE